MIRTWRSWLRSSKLDGVRRARRWLRVVRNRNNLAELAKLFHTNKWGSHYYMRHYQRFFEPLRNKRLNVLEIGIGGEENPHAGGASLRVWKTFFPKSDIFGIDVYDKKAIEEARITTFQGDQSDVEFLNSVANKAQGFDIIVDDGSHVSEHVIITFETLFPHLRDGGWYVIEDTQYSYWPGYGGSSTDFNSALCTVGYFKRLADAINFEEVIRPGYSPSYFDRNIVSLHFYHNLIFIEKGSNSEGSNVLKDNATDRKDILGNGD